MNLDHPLSRVVGARTAAAMDKGLSLKSAGDLLAHLPRRYAERAELTDLDSLRDGEEVTVLAEIRSARSVPLSGRSGGGGPGGGRSRARSREDVVVTDGRGELHLVFFSQGYRLKDLRPGVRGLFAGKVSSFRGTRQLAHPEYQLLGSPDDDLEVDAVRAFTRALIPIYPATAKLPSWRIAESVAVLLDQLDELPDPLPADILLRRGLCSRDDAVRALHRPDTMADVTRGRARLRYDEAFVLQVELARRRLAAQGMPAKPRVARPDGVLAAFDRRLPFTLTDGQRRVGESLAADLASEHPMHRLLQGEVGSGKTVVALRAMLAVIDAGGQCALLAPTEVLAQQHHRSLSVMLGPLAERGMLTGSDVGTRLVLLTGSSTAAERRQALLAAASGEAGIVVGTHALLQERVQFAELGLVVVDEQHRFGVEQRAALAAKGPNGTRPHVLVMTATPIPRTVAMTVFGDLDVSSLTELPQGRQPIASHVVLAATRPQRFHRVWERVCEDVQRGHQAFVVCPRIGDDAADLPEERDGAPVDESAADEAAADESAADESAPSAADPFDGSHDDVGGTGLGGTGLGGTGRGGTNPARAPVDSKGPGSSATAAATLGVLDVADRLRSGPLADVRVDVLHGRMPSEEKDEVMRRFAAGEVDVLVATTVIEVGIDVPNASTMVVLDADRFGVSQLHQLRGRVGRGEAPGLCLLVTFAPDDSPALPRLEAVAGSNDGAVLAELDLRTRREGDVLGASQSGRRSHLRLLSVLRDGDIIAQARHDATELVSGDPQLRRHPGLAAEVSSVLGDERGEFLEKT